MINAGIQSYLKGPGLRACSEGPQERKHRNKSRVLELEMKDLVNNLIGKW